MAHPGYAQLFFGGTIDAHVGLGLSRATFAKLTDAVGDGPDSHGCWIVELGNNTLALVSFESRGVDSNDPIRIVPMVDAVAMGVESRSMLIASATARGIETRIKTFGWFLGFSSDD